MSQPSMSALERDVLNESYEDIKNLVYSIIHKYVARHPHTTFEELRSVGDYYFVKAYNKFDRTKGAKLSTWVAFVVTKQLQTYLNKTNKHRFTLPLEDEILAGVTYEDSHFVHDLQELLAEDSRRIIDLLMDCPAELQALFIASADTKGRPHQTKMREALASYLEEMGWGADQISSCFEEICWTLRIVGRIPTREKPRAWGESLRRQDIWMLARVGITPAQVRLALAST